MVLDNMSERQREGRPSQRDIPVPVHCRQQTKKSYEQLLVSSNTVSCITILSFIIYMHINDDIILARER